VPFKENKNVNPHEGDVEEDEEEEDERPTRDRKA
jgi:hypothetical protein